MRWKINLHHDHGLTFYLWRAPALNCNGVQPTAPSCILHTAFQGLITISSWNHLTTGGREGDDICLTSAQQQAARELETCNTDENIQLKVQGVITVAGHYCRASVPFDTELCTSMVSSDTFSSSVGSVTCFGRHSTTCCCTLLSGSFSEVQSTVSFFALLYPYWCPVSYSQPWQ